MDSKQQKYCYIVHFQYLGFRYHGWQKQPGVKTIESMIEKTLIFILGHTEFKIFGASRTDSKVSANHSAFMLFVYEGLDLSMLKNKLNLNLPNDIRVTDIEIREKSFSIINAPKMKEYLYLFAHGCKAHPFAASLMCSFNDNLDIELMKQGAELFEGKHNFIQYCTKPNPETMVEREVVSSSIVENTFFNASFFPDISYAYRICAKGFLRYQVRLIMGQLVALGRGMITLDNIRESLSGENREPLREIAPGSGLMLNKIVFEEES